MINWTRCKNTFVVLWHVWAIWRIWGVSFEYFMFSTVSIWIKQLVKRRVFFVSHIFNYRILKDWNWGSKAFLIYFCHSGLITCCGSCSFHILIFSKCGALTRRLTAGLWSFKTPLIKLPIRTEWNRRRWCQWWTLTSSFVQSDFVTHTSDRERVLAWDPLPADQIHLQTKYLLWIGP